MDPITELLSTVRSKLGLPLSIHLGIVGFLLLLEGIGISILTPSSSKILYCWAALNLMSLASRPRYITPQIANPKCPHCGKYMSVLSLRCEECGGTFQVK